MVKGVDINNVSGVQVLDCPMISVCGKAVKKKKRLRLKTFYFEDWNTTFV